jgi:hypothetical protein
LVLRIALRELLAKGSDATFWHEMIGFAAPCPSLPRQFTRPRPRLGPFPSITRAQQAGHWALDGAAWKWVPPETLLRPVQTARRVAGKYIWRDQRYVWVPAHYAD